MRKRKPKTIGRQIGHGIGQVGHGVGGVIDFAAGSAGKLGRLLGTAMRLPGIASHSHQGHQAPGSRPGIEHHDDVNTPPDPGSVSITCIDYCPDRVESAEIPDVDAFLAAPRPDWATMRWINVTGLHPYVINKFRLAFGYHTLAAEDVAHVPQRPTADVYTDDLFIVARMLRLENDALVSEQMSLFLRDGQVITFQELPGDPFEPVRERIRTKGTRLRTSEGSYLVYALLDAAVDHCYPILERYGDLLEELEEDVLDRPTPDVLHRTHAIKRELSMLRRVMWPMREVIGKLMQPDTPFITEQTRTYLRDVYEHNVQIIDIVETFREMGGGLTDLYMSAISNRMNEVMKVLTIMASLFIPTTFLAGLWGMNFSWLPGMDEPGGFWWFLGACAAIVGGMLFMFWRRGWIGK